VPKVEIEKEKQSRKHDLSFVLPDLRGFVISLFFDFNFRPTNDVGSHFRHSRAL
jgi:hypothetical protein